MAQMYIVLGLFAFLAAGIGGLIGVSVWPIDRRGNLMNKILKKRFGIVAVNWPDGLREYLADMSESCFDKIPGYLFIHNKNNTTRKGGLMWELFDPKDCLPPELLAMVVEKRDPAGNVIFKEDGSPEFTELASVPDFHVCVPKSMTFVAPKAAELGRDPQFISAFNSKQKIAAESGAIKRQRQIFMMVAATAGIGLLIIIYQYLISQDLMAVKHAVEAGTTACVDAVRQSCTAIVGITPSP